MPPHTTIVLPAFNEEEALPVVVDDIRTVGADGNPVNRERTPEEIERLTALVREAIGFDARRGDSVRVMNNSFLTPEPVADLPEVPMWEQGWFLDIVKQVGGLLLVLILIFVVLRPTMKRLTASHTELATTSGGAAAAGDAQVDGDRHRTRRDPGQVQPEQPDFADSENLPPATYWWSQALF